jgi:hypothetical protein
MQDLKAIYARPPQGSALDRPLLKAAVPPTSLNQCRFRESHDDVRMTELEAISWKKSVSKSREALIQSLHAVGDGSMMGERMVRQEAANHIRCQFGLAM